MIYPPQKILCTFLKKSSLITCRHRDSQSLCDELSVRVARALLGVLAGNSILVRALKFPKQSALAAPTVHSSIAGRRRRSCEPPDGLVATSTLWQITDQRCAERRQAVWLRWKHIRAD